MALIIERIRTGRAEFGRPREAGRSVSAGWAERSRQNRNRTGLPISCYGGEHNLINDQHVGISRSAHSIHSERLASGICRIRRRRCSDGSRRRKTFSVVLLDEVEKAHPDVLELFFQVLIRADGRWRRAAKSTLKTRLSSLTCNACTDQLMKLCADPETMPTPNGIIKAIKPELNKNIQARVFGTHGRHPLLSHSRREPEEDHLS